jgi:hypothetical protein
VFSEECTALNPCALISCSFLCLPFRFIVSFLMPHLCLNWSSLVLGKRALPVIALYLNLGHSVLLWLFF